ncbi:hypothetical protein ABK040_005965 [Willaertia magna]
MSKQVARIVYQHSKEGEYVPDNVRGGNPVGMLNNAYTNDNGCFTSGSWGSTVGKWYFEQKDYEEFCYILEGKARLIANGEEEGQTFVAGDCFVIPDGFKGFWETIEPVKKFYCVYEKKDTTSPQSKL